jgi:hypothetical protein
MESMWAFSIDLISDEGLGRVPRFRDQLSSRDGGRLCGIVLGLSLLLL